jgi:YYY domain-containing protein
VGIDGLDRPTDCKANPGDCTEWYPTAWWFWWRATRIATQWDWREFPFFTFLLGDLHAHLLSIPFVLMAMAIALNTLRWQGPLVGGLWPGVALALNHLRGNIGSKPSGGTTALSSVTPVPPGAYPVAAERSLGLLASAWEGFAFWVAHPARFLAMSVLLGSLGFINSWDLPTFLGLVCFAAGIRNYLSEGHLSMSVVGRTLGFTVPLAALSFILYLPFYVNFHPVGGTILPIQLATIGGWPPIETMATRPHHFAYLWATILWPTVTFAVIALGPWQLNRSILRWALLPAFVPFLAWLFLVTASHGPLGLIDEIDIRGPWWITLVFLLAAVTVPALAFGRYLLKAREKENGERQWDENLAFALAVAGTAILILLGTELYWVQDPVNVRSNTVFRLNYQSWIMLAVSGAVGLYYITSRWRLRSVLTSAPRLLWVAGTIFFIGAGLVYPVIASMNRTVGFRAHLYLDGLAAMRAANPSEFEAVRWLEDNVQGTPTILEAVGGDYSTYGRVSSRTGLPTLLGWPDHEYRWRDSTSVQGTRKDDTQRIYQTTSAQEAKELLDKYDVEYVYVGSLEREAYGDAGLAKFATFMEVAFQNSGVTIYRMPDTGQISVRAP